MGVSFHNKKFKFNLSTYVGEYMPHIFNDFKNARQAIINRQKTKNIIDQVLVTSLDLSRLKYMRNITSLMLDFWEIFLIKMNCFLFLEQNQTKSIIICNALTDLLTKNKI